MARVAEFTQTLQVATFKDLLGTSNSNESFEN